jgi:hypothetical protein
VVTGKFDSDVRAGVPCSDEANFIVAAEMRGDGEIFTVRGAKRRALISAGKIGIGCGPIAGAQGLVAAVERVGLLFGAFHC